MTKSCMTVGETLGYRTVAGHPEEGWTILDPEQPVGGDTATIRHARQGCTPHLPGGGNVTKFGRGIVPDNQPVIADLTGSSGIAEMDLDARSPKCAWTVSLVRWWSTMAWSLVR